MHPARRGIRPAESPLGSGGAHFCFPGLSHEMLDRFGACKTHSELRDIDGLRDDFVLTVSERERQTQYRTRLVVLATGSYDSPNLLGIPGEQDPAVQHFFGEWRHIRNQRLLFIGGGFSSADGIVALCASNEVLWVTTKPHPEIAKILHDQQTKWGQPDAKVVNTKILCDSRVLSVTDRRAQIQTTPPASCTA